MNTLLILKPIVDALYEEMKEYKDKTDNRIDWLQSQLDQYKNKESYDNFVNEIANDINDDDYAEEALAPCPVVSKEEIQENDIVVQEETKNVKMIAGKEVKEYMKEYQRSYRKKQKNIILNK